MQFWQWDIRRQSISKPESSLRG